MANKSTDQRNSRYVQGGSTDIFKNRLGWWERNIYINRTSDIDYEITQKFHLRPDLVAKQLYGTTALMWLVLQYSNIVDINTEFVAGKIIKLPAPERVATTFLNSAVGSSRQS